MKFLKIEKTIFVCQACYERFSRNEHPESRGWDHTEAAAAPFMSCDECGKVESSCQTEHESS